MMKTVYRLLLLAGIALSGCGLMLLIARPTSAVAPGLQLQAPTGPQSAITPIDLSIHATQLANLGAWEFDLSYDPSLIEITGVTIGDFFARTTDCDPAAARCAIALGPVVDGGKVRAGAISYGVGAGANGDGLIATLHIQPKGIPGVTTLHFTSALLTDAAANPITPTTADATLELTPPAFGGNHTLFLPVVTR
jgi:hypothetical protein